MAIFLLIVGLLLFVGLVVVHEFGHFIMARRNGVDVEEFGIFFPPRLFKHTTKSGWDFTINALPLGGFVRLKGEHDSDTEPGSFGAATTWTKSKIIVAGVVMNLLVALILFTVLAIVGMPKLIPNQFTVKRDTQLASHKVLIGYIEPGSPASKAGLHSNDEIRSLEIPGYSPVAIPSTNDLRRITSNFAGKSVKVFYVRDGRDHVARATLLTTQQVNASKKTNTPKGYLGIGTNDLVVQRSTWSAPIVAIGLSGQLTMLTFQGLGHALGGLGSLVAGFATGNSAARQHGQAAASSQVSGPIGIYFILKDFSAIGLQYMLLIVAVISLTLAVMNILPIPALDGGRLWLMLGTRAVGKPLAPRTEELVNAIGFMILMGVFVLISIVDVHRFILG